ncbi:MAG: phage tail terminator-like protein [Gemmatimonas sp.]|uniref:phage tail terminator-like protein n=1 Tax=Gemmatimonas sp. TaxID=1962908 RepID=UPI00391F118B
MIYQQLLAALRALVLTVPGLPAERRWLNTAGAAPSTAFVDDGFTSLDSTYAECGPDAMRRCEATYRVSIRVPAGTDAHAALSVASAIEDTFASATLTVGGQSVEVLSTRSGPALAENAWLHIPVSVSLTFDHT